MMKPMDSGSLAPHTRILGFRWNCVASLHNTDASPLRKEHPGLKVLRPQNRAGPFRKQKNVLSLPEFEPVILGDQSCSSFTIPNDLPILNEAIVNLVSVFNVFIYMARQL
jgi:hypothetical protein